MKEKFGDEERLWEGLNERMSGRINTWSLCCPSEELREFDPLLTTSLASRL